MRSTKASGVGPEMLDQLRPVIQASAAQHNAPLVGLPVALHNTGTYDPESIQQIFAGYTGQSDSGRNLSTPAELIRRIGECRVVVTGAYHPAVFALAQGIPAVCLSQSRYSTIKFQGLRDLFGSGCELVMLDRPDFGVKIQAVIRHAWEAAEHWRPSLLQAAERQILASHAAYQQLTRIAGGSRVRPDHIEAESEVPVPERVLQGVA